MRPDTIKILEKSKGSYFSDIVCSNIFLDGSPEQGKQKQKNYWDYIKMKIFCTEKESLDKTKKQTTEWKKIFANDIPIKG